MHPIPALLLVCCFQQEEDRGTPRRMQPEPIERERDDKLGFWLGARGGWLQARGADDGTLFGGAQAQLRLIPWLAVEGDILVHRDELEDGNVEVYQYPVQASLVFFPFPDWPLEPYALAGVGWYYTTFNFKDDRPDDTDNLFGVHAGVGLQLTLGRVGINADFRYIWTGDADADIVDKDFSTWMISLGAVFKF